MDGAQEGGARAEHEPALVALTAAAASPLPQRAQPALFLLPSTTSLERSSSSRACASRAVDRAAIRNFLGGDRHAVLQVAD